MAIQNTYKRNELACSDFLLSLQRGLRDDYFAHQESLEFPKHKEFITKYSDCRPDIPLESLQNLFLTKQNDHWVHKHDAMNGVGIKYDIQPVPGAWKPPANLREFYPTAMKLLDRFGDLCPNATYSTLPANTIFGTHYDEEMAGLPFIRIHIPLIVPPGEIYLQVGEEKIYWNDIFAFNNQVPHSAHNLTDVGRLVFLLDLHYSVAGIVSD